LPHLPSKWCFYCYYVSSRCFWKYRSPLHTNLHFFNLNYNQSIQPIAALWLNFSLFFRFPHRMNFTNPIMQRAHGFI
jgi:hypothetical protein